MSVPKERSEQCSFLFQLEKYSADLLLKGKAPGCVFKVRSKDT